ncbi:MAG TPA: transglycosylase domain-containing protein, partial [Nocardioidaceae bacterium]|nr:transglycosylase domain-containing protein [Nocardioidaceae bacterium]
MSARRDDRLDFASVLSHLAVMVAVAGVMGVLVAGLVIPFAGMAGLGARSVAESMDNLPADLEAEPLAERTRMLDTKGNVVATFYDQNRVNVRLTEVAPIMRKAIIAIEDYRFYEHGALDLKGTLRAFVTNQASDGVVQGGSSITQQMVKLTLINQAKTAEEQAAATADTYERKLNELRYAIAFEEKYDKDWILERYLNIAYYGDGAYGIQAASRHYFSKPASELGLKEAALLAGLVKNPTGYDPTNDPADGRERRDVVINRMAELNVVSRSEARKAENQRLGLKITPSRNGCLSSDAPFFCNYAWEYLLADESLGRTEDARRQLLNSGGLTIKTTIDQRAQRAADAATRQAVNPTDQAIGGLAMVEPGTGEVRAIAQSRPMGRDRSKGQTFLNYVVDSKYGDSNGFQPGSTFKVFVLATAIKQGTSLTTQINSPQQVSIPVSRYRDCEGPLQSSEVWDPQNSTGAGTYDLYTGTRESVNTFFAQLELRTGLCAPYELAQDMGIDLDNPATEMVPSFTLGVADVSPLEMAGAYATFAARGLHCENRPVTQILDNNAKPLKEYAKDCEQVLPNDVADAVNDILRGVQEPDGFGFSAGLALDQVSAGKTGTTSDNKAVWFVGYTPNMAAASMIAGANQAGQPQALDGQYVGGNFITSDGAAGSTLAGPQWAAAMKAVQGWLPDKEFTSPDPQTIEGQLVTVPSVYGQDPEQAAEILRDRGLYPSVGPMVDSSNAYGTVAYLSPGSGTQVGSGSSVTIYISDGTPYVPPPPDPEPQP